MESTVRGPAWRFLDLARRLERAIALLGSVEAALGLAVEPLAFQPLAESLLSVNESLVAYRRRHRSDVEADAAIALVIHDESNPRSLVTAVERLRRHAEDGAWGVGVDLADEALATLSLPLHELLPAARAVIDRFGHAVVERWFSSPVSPILMRPTDEQTGVPA